MEQTKQLPPFKAHYIKSNAQKILDILNEGFELFLSTEEFDLDNYNDLQNAKNKFFNNVMIYG